MFILRFFGIHGTQALLGEKHCGTCGTCTERRQALKDAGIDDPTEYLK